MTDLWHKNYTELRLAGRGDSFYSAHVRPHHWDGYFMFRAYPNSGDWCVEYVDQDPDKIIALANRWASGDTVDDFYSASL